ncbi:hypothetical protein Q3G72_031894 [Acer saccharum]|nr:hypothetical protein Q3G72_031894 [Acer saccharum]
MKKVCKTKSGNATGLGGGGTANTREPSLVEGATSGGGAIVNNHQENEDQRASSGVPIPAENVGGGEGQLSLSSKRRIEDVPFSNYFATFVP